MPSERYLKLRRPNVKDMHNNELLKACKEDNQILDEFLRENKDFIFSIIIRYKGSIEEIRKKFNVEEQELLQHAYIGVITALRDFDFERGVKFTTFVVRPILWEINQLLYCDSWIVRISRGAVEIIKRIKEVENTLGYLPSEEDLSNILKIPVERIHEILRFAGEMEHIDGMENFEIHGENDSEDSVVNRIYINQLIEQSNLTDFEKKIVEMIKEGMNNSQISERLKVYPMTVNRTINRIRRKINNLDTGNKRQSKYEDEISLISEEMSELETIMNIDDMKDLLDVCGYDVSQYTPRILYYIRQKALQRSSLNTTED